MVIKAGTAHFMSSHGIFLTLPMAKKVVTPPASSRLTEFPLASSLQKSLIRYPFPSLRQKAMFDESLILLGRDPHIFTEYLNKISLLAEPHHVAHIGDGKALIEQEQLALLNAEPVQIVGKRADALGLESSAEIAGGTAHMPGHLLQLEGLREMKAHIVNGIRHQTAFHFLLQL